MYVCTYEEILGLKEITHVGRKCKSSIAYCFFTSTFYRASLFDRICQGKSIFCTQSFDLCRRLIVKHSISIQFRAISCNAIAYLPLRYEAGIRFRKKGKTAVRWRDVHYRKAKRWIQWALWAQQLLSGSNNLFFLIFWTLKIN